MTPTQRLVSATRPFLTDGGFETSLFFLDGFDAPEFAALMLLDDPEARSAMDRYFDRFLAEARAAQTGFVLDTVTWRGSVAWAEQLGRAPEEMLRLSRDAVDFAKTVRARWKNAVSPIVLNGVVGPAGDGYSPETQLSARAASQIHRPQIATMVARGVDMISAITMTHVGEAVGITRAALDVDVPVVVSFTVETDGRLPTGEPLGEAIAATDEATGNAPLYYMVNCAHPDHFRPSLEAGSDWINRIGGLRANTSRQSHADRDAAEELDDGDPKEFRQLHADLVHLIPQLRVIGGCCGTDHRHVGCVSDRLLSAVPA